MIKPKPVSAELIAAILICQDLTIDEIVDLQEWMRKKGKKRIKAIIQIWNTAFNITMSKIVIANFSKN